MKINNKMIEGTDELVTGFNAEIFDDAYKSDILDTNSSLKVPTEKAIVSYNASGWLPANETWTYSNASAITIAGDKRLKYSNGMKFKCEQEVPLTAYWTFNSSSTPEVGSFTMANIGTPTYNTGKFGNALTLNGTDQALSITDSSLLKPTGNFTIGCWIKRSNINVLSYIFTSFYHNTAGGFGIGVLADNTVFFQTGKNTGTVAGVDYTILPSKTTITDANYHYVVFVFKNNVGYIYIDGKLDSFAPTFAPVYNTTNYVRIGCFYNASNANATFFNGQIDDLFLINGYALDEETIRNKYITDSAQEINNVTVPKKFLVNTVDYSSPNTTITLNGCNEYSLANSTITNPYYSMADIPYGFSTEMNKYTSSFYSSNYIINGNFDVWQRATSLSSGVHNYVYCADRWINVAEGTTSVVSRQPFTIGQTEVPGEPSFYHRTVVSALTGAGDRCMFYTNLESGRTLAGKTATLSFYAKASEAGKYMAVEFCQSYGTGGSPSAGISAIGVTKFALTTSWQKYTLTVDIPSVAGKTFGTTYDGVLGLVFWFDAGSDYNSRTNSLGHQSGTFYIAQVMLNEGAVAEPFQYFGGSKISDYHGCLRYYQTKTLRAGGWPTVFTYTGNGDSRTLIPLSEKMRINNPAITVSQTEITVIGVGELNLLSNVAVTLNPAIMELSSYDSIVLVWLSNYSNLSAGGNMVCWSSGSAVTFYIDADF